MGRPSKYKKEFCQALIDHMEKGFSINTFSGYLYKNFKDKKGKPLKVNPDTTYEWVTVYPEFSESRRIGDSLHQYYYEDKVNQAIEGKIPKGFPSSSFIFLMKNKFRWRDDPHNEEASDDRPSLSDIMKSVENLNASNNSTKKNKSSRKSKKRSRSSH